jgi:cobalamin biosynthesis Mg chelatase CobN
MSRHGLAPTTRCVIADAAGAAGSCEDHLVSRTPEERQRRAEQKRRARARMTPEQREAVNAKARARAAEKRGAPSAPRAPKLTPEERTARSREQSSQRRQAAAAARKADETRMWIIGGGIVLLVILAMMWSKSTAPPAYTPDGQHICNDGWVTPSNGPGTCSSHGGER